MGSLLMCLEDLKKFMGISKITTVGQRPGSTLGFLFLFSRFFMPTEGACKERTVVYRERRWTVEKGVTGG